MFLGALVVCVFGGGGVYGVLGAFGCYGQLGETSRVRGRQGVTRPGLGSPQGGLAE